MNRIRFAHLQSIAIRKAWHACWKPFSWTIHLYFHHMQLAKIHVSHALVLIILGNMICVLRRGRQEAKCCEIAMAA